MNGIEQLNKTVLRIKNWGFDFIAIHVKAICMVLILVFLSACEVKMAPSQFWETVFTPDTDSEYYKKKSENLVHDLTQGVQEYEINKVVVLDLVDDENKVPILGEYMSSRVVEAITRGRFFRVSQKGEVLSTLERLELKPSVRYTKEEIQRIGHELKAQAIINGKVRDIGANIDVHVSMVDIASGEVIASATEQLNRTRFAVELLRHY
ncbi:hypothetical protein NITGR_180014 [Nitrospina gracilis 3/211]|uniref:FlgO domain-containing protein n=1 Tax=Nitrospina gracilis (strain 3/211) TaxID=1266370 RepID=M1YWL1_NITG3|nr:MULTISPECIES: hypothetical protein [Nitrospina]MCF8722919.1 TolB-like protein [Nitrospina sp. Nb-3]CCQ89884.1 hypothetical protein NITGR_180014 [Nitrospina gracilis 3/211]